MKYKIFQIGFFDLDYSVINIDPKDVSDQFFVSPDGKIMAFGKSDTYDYWIAERKSDFFKVVENIKDIPSYGDIIEFGEFIELCKDGSLIDYDGFGYYSDGIVMSDNTVIKPSEIVQNDYEKGWKFIVWINK